MIWKNGCLLALGLMMAQSYAQPTGGQAPQQSPFLFFEAVNLAADEPGTSRIDVHYRIDSDFFVAVRNSDPSFPWQFKRRGEVFVELLDSANVSQARQIQSLELGANTSERNFETREWNQGIFTFTLPPGLYTIVFEVTDFESERRYLDRQRSIRAVDVSRMKRSTPVFVYPGRDSSAELLLHNMGGDLYFGQKAALFLQSAANEISLEDPRVSYSVHRLTHESEEPEPIIQDSSVHPQMMDGITLKPVHLDTGVGYKVGSSPTSGTAGIIVPFAGQRLPLGNYRLSLTIAGPDSQRTTEKKFRMIWPEMPFSLRDPEYAIEALRYVVPEAVLDSIKDRATDARIRTLEEFWKPRDTTPRTAYNEVMTEYYRRVDHARRSFATLRESDGMKTDRGRIYILYGPPSHVDRSLNPASAFQEVWEYENHGKKFIFVDEGKSGNYVLVQTQTL